MIQREKTIDILRGLAIFAMIGANMSAHSLSGDRPFLFRLYGSLAALIFVFLSGMMVVYTAKLKSYNFSHYLKRASLIFVIAALIDVCLWGIYPFMSFDVLYIIATSTLVIYFFNRLSLNFQALLILIIFALTPIIQYQFGYNASEPVAPQIFPINGWSKFLAVPISRQFFIDGWFPVFPWLGVALLGSLVSSYKSKIDIKIFNRNLSISGLILLISGIAAWIYFNPKLYIRDGYSELFYPPILYYFSAYVGLVFILLATIHKLPDNLLLKLLRVYGRSSLLVYIFHIIFIVTIFDRLGSFSFLPFIFLYLAHAGVLWVICYKIQQIKNRESWPLMAKMILGSYSKTISN